jgi:4-amino-4-deoxy-L-arabinose transferase-like glycosyltransferase
MGKKLDNIWEHKWVVVFSLIMFVVYLSTLSCSFDDEDSILFDRGMKDYNVAEYRPHPPGYPVYIFFGKISRFFIHDDILSMTVLSAIFGALSLVVFYFLVFEMFSRKTALMSTMILGVTPLFWLNSLKAMSDMMGLFFILLSMYFVYKFMKYRRASVLYLASFVSAVAMGVRFHAVFILVPLLVYAYIKARDKKKIFYGLIWFFLGILVWFVPMVIASGVGDYFRVMVGQFFRGFGDRDLALEGGFGLVTLLVRVKSFFGFFLSSGYGIELWGFDLWYIVSSLAYLFFMVLIYGAFKNRGVVGGLKDKRIFFFLVGLAFYVIITMVIPILPPHNPRYFLPLIVFVSLLFGLGVSLFGKFELLAFGVLFVLLIGYSVPLVGDIHDIPSAPAQVVDYIKANYNYNSEGVVVFVDGVNRGFFMYYDLEYRGIRVPEVGKFSTENKTVLFALMNPDDVGEWNVTLVKKFERDFRIHMKQSAIYLYEVNGQI